MLASGQYSLDESVNKSPAQHRERQKIERDTGTDGQHGQRYYMKDRIWRRQEKLDTEKDTIEYRQDSEILLTKLSQEIIIKWHLWVSDSGREQEKDEGKRKRSGKKIKCHWVMKNKRAR